MSFYRICTKNRDDVIACGDVNASPSMSPRAFALAMLDDRPNPGALDGCWIEVNCQGQSGRRTVEYLIIRARPWVKGDLSRAEICRDPRDVLAHLAEVCREQDLPPSDAYALCAWADQAACDFAVAALVDAALEDADQAVDLDSVDGDGVTRETWALIDRVGGEVVFDKAMAICTHRLELGPRAPALSLRDLIEGVE